MANLIPALFAKGAATTSLGAGLKMGTTVGSLTAPASFTLAPQLGSTLSSGSLLTAGGGGLGGLGGAGGSLLAGGAGGAGGSLLGGGLGGLTSGASTLMPKLSSLNSAGGLGGLKSGADLAALSSKTLTPGQLQQLRASTASLDGTAGNILPGPTDYVKEFLGTSGPTGPSTQTLLGDGLKMPTGPAQSLKMPTITAETPISQGPLAFREAAASGIDPNKGFLSNAISLAKNPSMQGAADYIETHPVASAGAAYGLYNLLKPKPKGPEKDVSLIRPYDFSRTQNPEAYAVSPTDDSSERQYFAETFTPLEPYEAPGPEYKKAAEGGLMGLAVGGPVETMSAMNAIGGNMMYPQSQLQTPMYSNPTIQRPEPVNVISPSGDAGVGAYSGEPRFAGGGLSDLGSYSDGGRLLKGPGDGVSDSIPAVIGERQPARLADGEFVVPARIVSELGNGSTEAGARKLYAMMDRVQKARRKTVGKNRVATNTRAEKHLPA